MLTLALLAWLKLFTSCEKSPRKLFKAAVAAASDLLVIKSATLRLGQINLVVEVSSFTELPGLATVAHFSKSS